MIEDVKKIYMIIKSMAFYGFYGKNLKTLFFYAYFYV